MDSRGMDDGMPDEEPLSALLRAWRQRVTSSSVAAQAGKARRGAGLSQADVAHMTGVSTRWYRSLEGGKEANYSPEFLDNLAVVLRLSRAERDALYLKVLGHPPTPPGGDGDTSEAVWLQRFIDGNPTSPALVADISWNIVSVNEPLAEYFPWATRGVNLMRSYFLNREVREQLVNWEDDWARVSLGQIRHARIEYPDNWSLYWLERDVLEQCPEVRELWNLREVYDHADGALRKIKNPHLGCPEVSVRMITLTPMRNANLRVNLLVQVDT